jgi:hypothetical protein
MKALRNILFGIIYTFIYFLLAIMSTGGGHGNFFLLSPITTCILVFVALYLLAGLESLIARISFVVSMLMHYLVTLILCFDSGVHLVENWNEVPGREGIFVTTGFYILGQLIIWLVFFISLKNRETLK